MRFREDLMLQIEFSNSSREEALSTEIRGPRRLSQKDGWMGYQEAWAVGHI